MKSRVYVNAIRKDGSSVKLFSRQINPQALWYRITKQTKGVELLKKGVHVLAYLTPAANGRDGYLKAVYPVGKTSR